jgi:hypothetical protein
MLQNWGQIWTSSDSRFVGQGLSFRVITGDGSLVELDDVVPQGWAFD